MLNYPNINPVAFYLGNWPIYWYGLMYLVGFLGGWGLLSIRSRHADRGFSEQQISDVVFFAAVGAILGGRLGYMVFYDLHDWFNNPLLIFKTWMGGMSFHGGVLGVLISLFLYAKKIKKPLLALTDLITPVVPIGLGAGRIGNFINGELWGRATSSPWGIIFPHGGPMARHPSQLYEFFLEGILLFLILWWYSRKMRPLGAVSGLFALFYGIFRIIAEFFREPDQQIGYFFGWITEGQLLSVPLIFIGIILLACAYKKGTCSNETIPRLS
jgi:phosphatidylglycerol:prolipoprotein diacylglycerol transferase